MPDIIKTIRFPTATATLASLNNSLLSGGQQAQFLVGDEVIEPCA
jgi:hypothetical protein